MAFPLKISMVVVGATATAGAGVLVVKGFSPSKEKVSIASLLSKDPSRRSIGTDETTFWEAVGKEYKKSNKDIGGLGNGETVPDVLKTTCKDKSGLKVESKDSEEYKDFSNYCTRFTLVSDLIKENATSRELIARAAGSTPDGKQAGGKYTSNSRNANKQLHGDIWNLSDGNTKHSETSSAPDSFINKCLSNAEKPFHDIKGAFYLDIVEFCTKDKVTASVGGVGG